MHLWMRQIKKTHADTTKYEIVLFLLTGLAKYPEDENTPQHFSYTQITCIEKALFDPFQ